MHICIFLRGDKMKEQIMSSDNIRASFKMLSIISMIIPMLCIAYIIIFKPTYEAAPGVWNADKYWMLFSLRYWAFTLTIVSICSSFLSVIAFFCMFKVKRKRIWLCFQLVSPLCAVMGIFVCLLIFNSGNLKI